jgi:hypothetical protein
MARDRGNNTQAAKLWSTARLRWRVPRCEWRHASARRLTYARRDPLASGSEVPGRLVGAGPHSRVSPMSGGDVDRSGAMLRAIGAAILFLVLASSPRRVALARAHRTDR